MTHTRRECVISDLRRRLGNAELLIERLKTETAIRTAEDSSAVDSTPAKQSPNAENADEDGVVVIDIEATLHAKTEAMKRLLESQTLSPELAALGRELVRLAEKSLEEVTE